MHSPRQKCAFPLGSDSGQHYTRSASSGGAVHCVTEWPLKCVCRCACFQGQCMHTLCVQTEICIDTTPFSKLVNEMPSGIQLISTGPSVTYWSSNISTSTGEGTVTNRNSPKFYSSQETPVLSCSPVPLCRHVPTYVCTEYTVSELVVLLHMETPCGPVPIDAPSPHM